MQKVSILRVLQHFPVRRVAGPVVGVSAAWFAAYLFFGSGSLERAAPGPPAQPMTPTRSVERPTQVLEVAKRSADRGGGVPAPKVRVSRLDFDSADDLYALANAAAGSTDPMTLLNGWHASITCMRTSQMRTQYEAIAAGGVSAADTERKRAAGVVLRKCAGFFNNDTSANEELRQRLLTQLRAHVSLYVPGLSQGSPSDEQIATAIGRGDWQTFAAALDVILPRVWSRAGIDPKSEDAMLFGVASLQALCDLGQDCSATGLSYALYCVNTGVCPGSWEAFWFIGMDAEQLPKVQKIRAEIMIAYLQKDFAYFGLKR